MHTSDGHSYDHLVIEIKSTSSIFLLYSILPSMKSLHDAHKSEQIQPTNLPTDPTTDQLTDVLNVMSSHIVHKLSTTLIW